MQEHAAQPRVEIPEHVIATLAEGLPAVGERVVAAVVDGVPGYAGALAGEMGATIEQAVRQALGGFLRLAAAGPTGDPSTPIQAAIDGAYALGRGEARSGRSMDALLAAYRVGAREAWRDMSAAAVAAGLDAAALARLAELVFAYIDGLSAASAAGHSEELAAEGRVRERRRERLAAALLAGRDEDTLTALAERAQWSPPGSVTAVLLPSDRIGTLAGRLGAGCLSAPDDAMPEPAVAVLLVPDADGPGRRHLMRLLAGRAAYVGPSRSWASAAASYARALRAYELGLADGEPVDTDEHLATLVLYADRDAHADLRAQAMAPLDGQPPATTERLAETLRSWLLHQGRREDVAADLHVHPQTVRYRMGQVRELFGDRLLDPDAVRDLVLALAPPPPTPSAG
ncbi:helix-turn-helix domain-containing protein [Luteipulveratus flavus]|uniref:Helix-turn-helix domain-containing protein n=1 Tax=Luteipulveratus flavus TaxID=3031728 RepID=A0ABT6CB45_9MICO|nr:helix-turn-helix domain-containing protein [Luteipulveratus sp. YIM 133296]MDF8265753.1 helix-turn-helix domain-containing protein [Luteipulveratus sp. YIM 133296]